jgi:translation initiation factor IF-2
MAKIRAYKLAEELGMDRTEFVEKATAAGIELRSAMASLEDADAEKLRKKLGVPKVRQNVTEKRVERGTGSAVIRRRKKVAEAPPPELVVEEPVVTPALPVEPTLPPAAPIEADAEPAPAVAEPEPTLPTPAPSVAGPAAQAAQAGPRPATESAGGAGPAGPAGPARPGKQAQQRKRVREVVNLREQERLARQATSRAPHRRQVTLEPRTAVSPRRRRRDAPQAPRPAAAAASKKEDKRSLRVAGSVAVGDLARMLGEKAPTVQSRLMALGTMVSVNQAIDVETARKVAAEFGFEVQDVGFREEGFLGQSEQPNDETVLQGRPPIITVMGHVDHGKTSLLDALRRTDVVAGEAGGITQHIGAYQVSVGDKKLTFIDTPGHAAFTEMRARGAQVTDMVILVVAATEGIMPQTVEAIDHSKAAGVPIVVAVNKCDLPGANSQQTRQRLMEHELVPEDFGGDVICVDVSAKEGTGLDQLLEMLGLQAEVLELKADPVLRASGIVLEARLDKGRGPVATVLVQNGTLRTGDTVVVGTHLGRVRAMEDENGIRVKEAGPSMPVALIGLDGVPVAGDPMHAVESERVAKDIVENRVSQRRPAAVAGPSPASSLEDLFASVEAGGVKELSLVVKADVHGSMEALRDALIKLTTESVKVNVIHSGVGAVSETDVMLARASGAIVIGFHVRPDPAARRAAESHGVDIRGYQVIYEATEAVQNAMLGLLPPIKSEAFLGRAEVRQTFTVPKVGTIAGCYITEGNVRRSASCRLVRDGVQIYEGRLSSLKRFKDDVREVATGFECGIGIENYNDVKIGDVIEIFVIEEKPATL